MVRLVGIFNVTLPVPIVVEPGDRIEKLEGHKFMVEGSEVELGVRTIEDPVVEDGSLVEPAKLKEISVLIRRDAQLTTGAHGEELIPKEEEEKFELVLIEATRRFVTAVKKRIRQWDLDTRHPVDAYDFKYFREGRVVATLEEGYKIVPKSASAAIWSRWASKGELSTEVWSEPNLVKPESIPLYQELLYDALNFRHNRRFDAAVLFSAMAAELILEEARRNLLKSNGLLTDEQRKKLSESKGNPARVKALKTVEPNIDDEKLVKLFRQRNDIVHRGKTAFTAEEAWDSIRTVHSLMETLETWL